MKIFFFWAFNYQYISSNIFKFDISSSVTFVDYDRNYIIVYIRCRTLTSKYLLDQIKKTVIFLGFVDENGRILQSGTGFLVNISNVFFLVTAKHVIVNPQKDNFQDKGMLAFFNGKDGKKRPLSIDSLKDNYHFQWIFHQNKNVDIAMLPFGIDPENDDLLAIADSSFLSTELYEGYDIFFLTYHPELGLHTKVTPLLRNGTISLINGDNTFLIDAAAFPGNSGSPVFLKPSAIRYNEQGNFVMGKDELGGKFLGIIGSYVPYQDVAVSTQTGQPRVIFQENTGLSMVWSVSFIKEIMESEGFKQQIESLLKSNSPS